MTKLTILAVAMASLPAIALAQGARPQSAILLLRLEPGRRSGDDERAICLDRRRAAAGQLSRYGPDFEGLEGLLALRRRDLYLRLFRDGHGGRRREGAGGNPAASQSLSRGGLGRGCRAIVSQLRRFARRRAPGFDHVEHGSNRRQEIRRSSHRLRPQKLGAGMTVSSAILLAHTADRVPALMQVAGLCKRYGEQRALVDISFAVNAGEVLGLIGPNGAGKTTLMEAVAGILAADDGRVLWRGTSLALPQRREFMFYLPDGLRPWEGQYAADVVEFFATVYGRPEIVVADTIRSLGLAPVLRKRIAALSKGYGRRLMLALALLTPHPLLLMDEPFDGFDLRQTREIMNVLRDVASNGRTLVLAIHQLGDAARVCDRFVLLADGRVRGVGTLAQLRAQAGKPAAGLEEVFLALT